jgi:hypothetical protein
MGGNSMKKVLNIGLILAFVFVVFSAFSTPVKAEDPTSRKVVVHYHRWDDTYDGTYIHTWGVGTAGVGGDIALTGTNDFGGYYEIFIDEDADAELGLILKYTAAWGDGKNDRDGWVPADGGDKPNRFIQVKDGEGDFVGFDENGVKHVFVYEGTNEVLYQDDVHGPLKEGFGTLSVVYFDPTQAYEDWNVWNWGTGTGGSVASDADGAIPFVGTIGFDGMTAGDPVSKVAHFSIASDADDTMGFIVRTDAWAKQCADDLFIDISDIKGAGHKTVFYMAGSCEFIDTFDAFEALVNAFEITEVSLNDTSSFTIGFNKPIEVVVDDAEIFDIEWFTLTDKDGTEVDLSSGNFVKGTNNVDEFTLFVEDGSALSGTQSPYTLTFSREEGEEVTTEIVVPSTPPTISIVGGTNVTVQLGDTYSLPAFSATESVNGENLPLYNVSVKEGHGYLNTGEAGVYEIVIIATDRYNNVAERTITITVEGEEAGMGALGIVLISVGIAVPVLAGGTVAFLKMRRGA